MCTMSELNDTQKPCSAATPICYTKQQKNSFAPQITKPKNQKQLLHQFSCPVKRLDAVIGLAQNL